MADLMKRSLEQSPKASPLGSRSPQILGPRQDSSGTLKTTISLAGGRAPSIVQKGPFYLCKDLPEPSEVTGAMNLIAYHGLQNAYTKFCGKKMKEELSSTLSLPGNINLSGADDNSSLRSVIEKPPITGKELIPLTSSQLSSFRLHPGQLPEQYRLFAPQKKKSKKRSKPDQEIKQGAAPSAFEGTPQEPLKKAKRKDKDKSKKQKKDKKRRKEKDKGSP